MNNLIDFSNWIIESTEDYSYRGFHKAPSNDGYDPSLDDIDMMFPGIYELPNADRVYGHSGMPNNMDRLTVDIIRSVKGKPDKLITIYRAVPASLDKTKLVINPGDWVTINRMYAIYHGLRFEGGYKLIELDVPVGHLYTEGNSIHEFGYDPN
jgi:hypothetical protein